MLTQQAPQKAAKALTLGFDLAPRDYYLILPCTLVAAPLWSHLPARVQTTLLKDVNALTADPEKRDRLRLLLSKPGGAELVVRSFAGRPDSLRELNRTLAREVAASLIREFLAGRNAGHTFIDSKFYIA